MVVAGHIGHPLLAADAAEVVFALLAVDTLGHLAVGIGIGYAALRIMQGERARRSDRHPRAFRRGRA